MTDWENVDLETEGDKWLVDALTFNDLLLEISCNLPEINNLSVVKQFHDSLERIKADAVEVFVANLDNIVAHAIETRQQDWPRCSSKLEDQQ